MGDSDITVYAYQTGIIGAENYDAADFGVSSIADDPSISVTSEDSYSGSKSFKIKVSDYNKTNGVIPDVQ